MSHPQPNLAIQFHGQDQPPHAQSLPWPQPNEARYYGFQLHPIKIFYGAPLFGFDKTRFLLLFF